MNQSILFNPGALDRATPAESPQVFWWRHLWWPLLAFTLAFAVLEIFSLDRPLAREWYYDVHNAQWLGAGDGQWWARGVLHSGGRWLVRCIAAASIAVWVLSFRVKWLRDWRRAAGFVALAMVLSTLVVGGLKTVTNVDCPWDLAGFGGDKPYFALFADRPDALPHAQCFPGAHASSGFALFCFYFVLRDRSRRAARWAFAGAVVVGIAFSIGQEARGAHFLSHDLTSAAIVWFVQLAMYAKLLRPSPTRAHKKIDAPRAQQASGRNLDPRHGQHADGHFLGNDSRAPAAFHGCFARRQRVCSGAGRRVRRIDSTHREGVFGSTQ